MKIKDKECAFVQPVSMMLLFMCVKRLSFCLAFFIMSRYHESNRDLTYIENMTYIEKPLP